MLLQLDIVLENVNATILVLTGVTEKLNQLSTEDQAKYHLDNSLGGRSDFLHRNTILKLVFALRFDLQVVVTVRLSWHLFSNL
jgi:histone deacetylase complex regulatory component SIN3